MGESCPKKRKIGELLSKIEENDFNKYVIEDKKYEKIDNLSDFTVIVGENGVGKTNFLKALRQYVVQHKNFEKPSYVIRFLTYGEINDDYDPNKHPFIRKSEFLNQDKFWKDYEKLNILSAYEVVTMSDFDKKVEEKCQLNFEGVDPNYKETRVKDYYRNRKIKQLSFGDLNSLLECDVQYEQEIEEINNFIESNEYSLIFPYKIKCDYLETIKKSELNQKIYFQHTKTNQKVKLENLSPGERLILTLLLTIREPDIMKINNEFNTRQILLLDEPDCHCHPDLVMKIIDILKNELVNKMEIQVIMTTHNLTTLYNVSDCYILKKYDDDDDDDGDKLVLKKESKSTAMNIIGKNLNDLLTGLCQSYEDFTNQKLIFKNFLKNKNIDSNDTIGRIVENLCYLTLKWNGFNKGLLSTKFLTSNFKNDDLNVTKWNFYHNIFNYEKPISQFVSEEKPYCVIYPEEKKFPAWDIILIDSKSKPKLVKFIQISVREDISKKMKHTFSVFFKIPENFKLIEKAEAGTSEPKKKVFDLEIKVKEAKKEEEKAITTAKTAEKVSEDKEKKKIAEAKNKVIDLEKAETEAAAKVKKAQEELDNKIAEAKELEKAKKELENAKKELEKAKIELEKAEYANDIYKTKRYYKAREKIFKDYEFKYYFVFEEKPEGQEKNIKECREYIQKYIDYKIKTGIPSGINEGDIPSFISLENTESLQNTEIIGLEDFSDDLKDILP
jgi:ABC-type branched-subunit amino acid transport system ATPase component